MYLSLNKFATDKQLDKKSFLLFVIEHEWDLPPYFWDSTDNYTNELVSSDSNTEYDKELIMFETDKYYSEKLLIAYQKWLTTKSE